jgi:hypothetical protein
MLSKSWGNSLPLLSADPSACVMLRPWRALCQLARMILYEEIRYIEHGIESEPKLLVSCPIPGQATEQVRLQRRSIAHSASAWLG